jgi:hypothetical protein
MIQEKEVKWLNSKDQIDNASEEELRRVLLTCDGNGVEFKRLALDRLIAIKQGRANIDDKSQYPKGTDLLWMAYYRSSPDGGDMDGGSKKIDGDAVSAMIEAQKTAVEEGMILQCLSRRF